MATRKSNAKKKRGSTTRTSKSRRKPAKPSWKRRIGVFLLKVVIFAVVAGVGAGAALTWHWTRDLPDVATLRDYSPPQTTRILDRNGDVLGEAFTERRTVIPMDQIPRAMVLCTLAAEDADFYRHEGLDYRGIARAIIRDILAGRAAQGASTITQQVVKLLLLTPERRLRRKVRELVLARRVEQTFSKEEILHLYLNHINYGVGRYGVEEAARYYFDKHASELTLAEAALLAGIPQAPARLSPYRHLEAATRRRAYVLRQLREKRELYWPDLSLEEIEAAENTPITLAGEPTTSHAAPEVVAVARRTLRDLVGEARYRRGGFTVRTTIDRRLQRATREAVQSGLRTIDGRHRYRGPLRRRRRAPAAVEDPRPGPVLEGVVSRVSDDAVFISLGEHEARISARHIARENPDELPLSEFAPEGGFARITLIERRDDEPSPARFALGPQAAAVVLDPASRDVLALVGGYEAESGFDRARLALRQPGSTFKPIVYLTGIRSRRFTAATLVLDAPAVYEDWRPSNYETWHFEGAVRLRQALARSINLVAVRVIEGVGPSAVISTARQLGIESELTDNLSLALGASEVRPIEMANAYATIAALGRYEAPRFVLSIEGPDGEEIALPPRPPGRDAIDPASAYIITSMMTSVVRDGTARRARRLGRPVAGKTGTSNDARDAWFVGFSPDRAAAVWVGFDDRRPLGRRESGGQSALPIWIDVMRAAHRGVPERDFPVPADVETVRIDPASGLRAYEGLDGAVDEVFLPGTAPTETVREPDVADGSTFLLEQFGGASTDADTDEAEAP